MKSIVTKLDDTVRTRLKVHIECKMSCTWHKNRKLNFYPEVLHLIDLNSPDLENELRFLLDVRGY